MTLAMSQVKLRGGKGRNEVVEELLKSFAISLEVTFIILIKLGLEMPESLYGRIQDGDLYLFMALAQVFEASVHMRRLKARLYQDNTV